MGPYETRVDVDLDRALKRELTSLKAEQDHRELQVRELDKEIGSMTDSIKEATQRLELISLDIQGAKKTSRELQDRIDSARAQSGVQVSSR